MQREKLGGVNHWRMTIRREVSAVRTLQTLYFQGINIMAGRIHQIRESVYHFIHRNDGMYSIVIRISQEVYMESRRGQFQWDKRV